jgi:hypothetical protein
MSFPMFSFMPRPGWPGIIQCMKIILAALKIKLGLEKVCLTGVAPLVLDSGVYLMRNFP